MLSMYMLQVNSVKTTRFLTTNGIRFHLDISFISSDVIRFRSVKKTFPIIINMYNEM